MKRNANKNRRDLEFQVADKAYSPTDEEDQKDYIAQGTYFKIWTLLSKLSEELIN